jgi:hypothetical protein
MGGTDDPSNLIKLTIEEHAEAHKKLWEEHGNEYDRIAWMGLSKMIDKQDIIKLILSENGKKNSKNFTREASSKGGKTSARLYPEKSSLAGKALWSKPGMREHLSKKRVEQSASGKNPMQGKKQRRVCCLCCRKEFPYNQFVVHSNKSDH